MDRNAVSATLRRVAVPFALAVLSPVAALADPDVRVGFGDPAYTVAATCDLARPLVVLHVSLQNAGADAAPETTLTVSDDRQTLSGQTGVPAIEAGASVDVAVELRHAGGGPAADVGGDHTIVVTAGDRTSDARTVTVPASLCGPANPGARPTGSKRPVKKTAPEETFANVVQSPILAALLPPSPTGVHAAAGYDECIARTGGATSAFGIAVGRLAGAPRPENCLGLRKSGHLVLLWNPAPAGTERLNGYRIYRNDHDGKRLLFATQDTSPSADVTDVPGLNLTKCYAVSAYAGTRESPLSVPFCTDSHSVVKIVRLSPVRVRTHREQANSDARYNRPLNENAVIVGYSFDNVSRITGGYRANAISRAAMLFDTAPFSGRRIDAATLSMKIARTEGADPQHSCATTIGRPRGYWWQNEDQIDATFRATGWGPPVGLPPNGPDVSANLRLFVEQWAKGGENFGIALRNDNEQSDNAPINQKLVCETTYFDPVLEVVYF